MNKITFEIDITEDDLEDFKDSLFMEKYKDKNGDIEFNVETALEIFQFNLMKYYSCWDIATIKEYFRIKESS